MIKKFTKIFMIRNQRNIIRKSNFEASVNSFKLLHAWILYSQKMNFVFWPHYSGHILIIKRIQK